MKAPAAVVAGALVLAAGAWAVGRAAAPPAGEWLAVERGDLTRTVEIGGTLRAVESATLGPPQVPDQWDFKLSFLAPEGAAVAAGDPVIGFDATQLERQREERQAEAQQAAKELEKRTLELAAKRGDLQLRLAEAEARRRRFEAAAKAPEEVVAAADLAASGLDLDLARREVAHVQELLDLERRSSEAELAALAEKRSRAAARVAELEAAIGRMTVRAPRAGTVVYLSRPGEEKPKVGDSVWQAQSLVQIPDLGRMEALGWVDEADVGRLAVGQPVRLTLDAHPGADYAGRVATIGRAVTTPERGSRVKVVEVVVELGESDPRRLRPGMRFRGEVVIERVADLLLVPLEAVELTARGPRVEVRRRWGVETVAPRLGRRGGGRVEVLDGLTAGDRVLRAAAEGGS
jgi:HlyD family secretion protein